MRAVLQWVGGLMVVGAARNARRELAGRRAAEQRVDRLAARLTAQQERPAA